jgi:transposase InsO family protein
MKPFDPAGRHRLNGVLASKSRAGNCCDNVAIESFWREL